MNASYKIVLLGAFILFAAVVGYYVFSGDRDKPDTQFEDEYAQQDPAPREPVAEPAPRRPVLEQQPVVEPQPEQVTIGPRPGESPAAPPRSAQDPPDDTLASAEDEEEDLLRPGPDVVRSEAPEAIEGSGENEPTTPDAGTAAVETDEPIETPRPGPPGPETTQEPAEPATQPEPQTDPEPEAQPETQTPRRPVPPSPQTLPRTYTVKAGDTFASIATEFYGQEAAWFEIAQANPSVDPKRLQVGQSIVLPNRQTVVREREEVRPPAPGKDQTYTVRPGDNLSKIAKRFYDDSEKWDLIYARNRNAIGPRPDALKVGMELIIPQAYDGAE